MTADRASTSSQAVKKQRVLGLDGRFTILLLGSDARPSEPGLRTDAILVGSVDPVTRRAALFSIPRDTINFPLSATRRYSGKINALYQTLAKTTKAPGTALRKIIGSALGIEIDAFAMVGFAGFRKLVNNVGGLNVTVTRAFYDRSYSIRRGQRGFGLTRGRHHLRDLRALAFARTRHADSDYARSRRQQQLIVNAIQKVRAGDLKLVLRLLTASKGLFKTDMPLADAARILAIVGRADLVRAKRTVFEPGVCATKISSASTMLNITTCKAWIKKYFPPVRPGGAWPPVPTP
ncbi:MAG: LCP family protein [Candidatus Limnocylindrales bacterium]